MLEVKPELGELDTAEADELSDDVEVPGVVFPVWGDRELGVVYNVSAVSADEWEPDVGVVAG